MDVILENGCDNWKRDTMMFLLHLTGNSNKGFSDRQKMAFLFYGKTRKFWKIFSPLIQSYQLKK